MNKHANIVAVAFSAVFMDMKLKGSLSHASINVPVSKLKKKTEKGAPRAHFSFARILFSKYKQKRKGQNLVNRN